jgi:hypothetical protein
MMHANFRPLKVATVSSLYQQVLMSDNSTVPGWLVATVSSQEQLRASIIRYLSRRDELHVNNKNATLGERVPSRRLASRRLNHRLRDKKATLQAGSCCYTRLQLQNINCS